MLSYFQFEAPIHRPSFFQFFSPTITDKTKISLTIKILHLGQGSFTRKARNIFTLKIIVSIFVKLFLILDLHLRQFFIVRIVVKRATVLLKQKNWQAVTWVRMRKKKPDISNTGKFFCFNNNVSNLYNNSVVAKTYGMSYIFTLLMFRKPNKTTIKKIKTTNFYRSTYLRFSFIFRYFKVFQVKRIVYI